MLKITVQHKELWDEKKEEFVSIKDTILCLEHSLVSVSKWEAKYQRPFLTSKQKMNEQETIDYIRFMTLTQNVDPNTYTCLSSKNIKEITAYMESSMTATWFGSDSTNKPHRQEQITSELIYYWMIALNIPMECQKWHLNRLLTLIRVCNIKNQPPKKRSRKEIMQRNAALNATRRKKFGSKG